MFMLLLELDFGRRAAFFVLSSIRHCEPKSWLDGWIYYHSLLTLILSAFFFFVKCKRLSYHLVDERQDLYAGKYIHYTEVCAWNGAIDYALKVNDQELIKRLQNKFEPFFSREKVLLPPMNHVDYNMFALR